MCWVLSKSFGAYRLRHCSACCALLWPPRLCRTKKMKDENDKAKEIEKKRGAHMYSFPLSPYVSTIQNVWTKVYKVRVHLAQIPVIKETHDRRQTDIRSHAIFDKIRAHMKRPSMQWKAFHWNEFKQMPSFVSHWFLLKYAYPHKGLLPSNAWKFRVVYTCDFKNILINQRIEKYDNIWHFPKTKCSNQE